jgi:DNA-binding response OmpR family regulator
LRDKILIVDDDDSIRWTLAEALRSWNYDSIQAARVAEAIRIFQEEEPGVARLGFQFSRSSRAMLDVDWVREQ